MVIEEKLASIKSLYPFVPKRFSRGKHSLSYVDEGAGPAMLMVHGNPTWSFYYRDLIKRFRQDHRVVAPDHMGCGMSDKPQDWDYTLSSRIADLEALVLELGLKDITLVVHDWGGAIGFGLALKRPELVKNIVILNTAAFASKRMPRRIGLCKNRFFGEFLVRRLNGFAWPATFMASAKGLAPEVKKGYLLPYGNYADRKAVSEFVRDIPMSEEHPSYATLKNIEANLGLLTCPKLILWGGKDFCFNDEFLAQWRAIYPESSVKRYPNAGHYVVEDETADVIQNISKFLEAGS